MALNIKNQEAHELAQRLSEATGESITKVVTDALREAYDKVAKRTSSDRSALAAELDAIAEHCASLPELDGRAPDEILGYDEDGLPS